MTMCKNAKAASYYCLVQKMRVSIKQGLRRDTGVEKGCYTII
jgi:hypothetical protein